MQVSGARKKKKETQKIHQTEKLSDAGSESVQILINVGQLPDPYRITFGHAFGLYFGFDGRNKNRSMIG